MIASLFVLLIATLAREQVRASGLLFAAVVVQVLRGVLGENGSAWFGALPGLNALAVAAAAVNLGRATVAASANRVTPRSQPTPPDPSQAQ